MRPVDEGDPDPGVICCFCMVPAVLGPDGDGCTIGLRRSSVGAYQMILGAHLDCLRQLVPLEIQGYLDDGGLSRFADPPSS